LDNVRFGPKANIAFMLVRCLLRPRLLHTAGGLFDQCGDSAGVGDINCVAARYLNDGGPGSFRHELLCGIRNHLVIADLEIPAGLGFSSRLRDRAGKGVDTPRYLRVGHESGGHRINVAGEGIREFGLVKKQIAVLRWQNRRHRGAGWRIGD